MKVEKILKGDDLFISEIRKQQAIILDKFTLQYNQSIWEKNFLAQVMASKPAMQVSTKPITIGVFFQLAIVAAA